MSARRSATGSAGVARSLRARRRRAGYGGSYVAVAVCTLIVCLGFVAAVIVSGTAALRTERSDALMPVVTEDRADALEFFGYAYGSLDDKPVTVVVLEPLEQGAPLPPGLSEWPEPGHAVVSPQLASELVGDRAELYGTVDRVLPASALETPTERRVYLRPAKGTLQPHAMMPITGFGTGGTEVRGVGYLYGASTSESVPLVLLTTVVPALLGVAVAGAVGVGQLRSTQRLLLALGTGRGREARLDVIENGRALLAGGLLAVLALGGAMTRDLVLPVVDARYTAADTRSLAVPALLAVILGVLLSVTVLLAARALVRRVPGPRARLRPWRGRLPQVGGAAAWFLMLVVAFIAPRLLGSSSFKVHVVTALALLLGLTAAAPAAALCRWLGDGLHRLSTPLKSPGLLVAGRLLRQRRGRSGLLATSLCAAIIIAGVVQLWTGAVDSIQIDAENERAEFGTNVLDIYSSMDLDLSLVVNALPSGVVAVDVVTTANADGDLHREIHGTCAALTALDLACPTSGTETATLTTPRQLYVADGDTRVTLSTTAVAGTAGSGNLVDSRFVLVSQTGASLDVDALQTLVTRTVPGAVVDAHSSSEVAAAVVQRHATWIILLAALGLTALATSLAVSVAAEGRAVSTTLAPVGAATGGSSMVSVAAAFLASIPLLVAGLLGVLVYHVVCAGMVAGALPGDEMMWQERPAFVWVALLLTMLTVVGAAVLGAADARRAAGRWRPGQAPETD